jgi:hypothetical protein
VANEAIGPFKGTGKVGSKQAVWLVEKISLVAIFTNSNQPVVFVPLSGILENEQR